MGNVFNYTVRVGGGVKLTSTYRPSCCGMLTTKHVEPMRYRRLLPESEVIQSDRRRTGMKEMEH